MIELNRFIYLTYSYDKRIYIDKNIRVNGVGGIIKIIGINKYHSYTDYGVHKIRLLIMFDDKYGVTLTHLNFDKN
jgi:hypothetical protein